LAKDPKQQKNLQLDAVSAETKLTQLEMQIESLKSQYDQHFAGVAKRAPLREHELWKREFNSIALHEIKSTALKFRHQGLKAKHIQLSNLWQKILKEIEEGTYKRDLFHLKAKEKAVNSEKPVPVSSPSQPKAKTAVGLESLYLKYTELAKAAGQSIPDKEKFLGAIQKQIETQKAKNPAAKIELGLQKDSSGKVQVKLKLQR